MKQFLAVYTGSPDSEKIKSWSQLSPAQRAEKEAAGMAAWMTWVQQNAASIVFMGGPLGKTKRVDDNGVADSRNNLAAFVVIQAESEEEATKKFLNHPHFSIFPGDAVEVMPCLPIPQRG